jgi:MFS family permease
VLYANYAGIVSVLLPAQVAQLDPVHKVGNLAVVVAVSAAVTIVAQPLLGALSDRTRSRLGRRAPVMIGSAVAAAAVLAGMGGAGSVALLAVLWSVAQFALNGVDITTSAYLADRIAAPRRGFAAGVFALAGIGGGIAGTVLGGILVGQPLVAYAVLGAAILLVVVAFVLLDRRAAVAAQPVQPAPRLLAGLRELGHGLRAQPAFAWTFGARVAAALAYQLVYGYLLYIGIDHLRLPESGAIALVALLTAVGGAGIVVAAVIGGWWSDRLGRRVPFLVAAGGLLAIGAVIPLLSPTVPGMVAMSALFGLGTGLSVSCGPALVAGVLPGGPERAGRGLGLYNVATNVPQVIAPLLAAAVITIAGYPALFVVAVVAALVSGLLASRIRLP